jgi:type IX secretion system PorP/SprF family membrane protein
MMKRLTILSVALLLGVFSYGQQIPQYSQYMINDYILNPGISGMHDYFEVKSNNRIQWVGVSDAPRTFLLSIHGPIKNMNMGLGGAIFSDVTGPTSRTGAYLSYAYHLKLSPALKLGMGLSVGLLQFRIDGTQITLRDAGDVALSGNQTSVYTADATFGFNLYHKNFNVGFSAPQLIGNKLEFYEAAESAQSSLARHFMLMGSYTFHISDDFDIQPSVLLKYVNPTPLQIDGGVKLSYRETVWLGATYRHDDAVSIVAGYTHKNFVMFAYSYDIPMSNLKNYSSGSHEIMIGVRFKPKRKNKSEETIPIEYAPDSDGQ